MHASASPTTTTTTTITPTSPTNKQQHTGNSEPRRLAVVCIGGGAGAEVVALASTLHSLAQPTTPAALEITAVDIADWSSCLDLLTPALSTPPSPSSHANNNAARQPTPNTTSPLINPPATVTIHFRNQDILQCSPPTLSTILSPARLCTIMFTLNELFTASVTLTTAFLLRLTDAMQPGSFLLVVDSPGSYSEIRLGASQTTKRYPMKWLLDHTLLDVAGRDDQAKWRKEEGEDSVWFRVDRARLRYALELENMRYQIHSYCRL